jgi:hypothetical protein
MMKERRFDSHFPDSREGTVLNAVLMFSAQPLWIPNRLRGSPRRLNT